jgi:hypothetical protein
MEKEKMMFLKRESVLDVSQYAFGNQPGLKWFLQPDVKDFLSGPLRLFSGELICVHDEFQSYLQHSFVWSELVTKATANAELKYAPRPTFTPKVRSLYRPYGHRFVTPTTSKYGKSEYWFPRGGSEHGSVYLTNTDEAAAVRYCDKSPVSHRESIYIRRDILASVLTKLNCRLLTFLWCFRYSERTLRSWRASSGSCSKKHGKDFAYELEFHPNIHGDRPLALSKSWMVGKRDFTDAILSSSK